MRDRDLVYISYSHNDKKLHRELRTVLDRDVRIKDLVWDDTKIRKGGDIWKEIKEHVHRAKIMVMLVSPHYLAEDCSAGECEVKPALEAREQGELTILWVPVRQVAISETPFPFIKAATDVSQPLDTLKPQERESAWEEVRDEIVGLLESKSSGEFDVFLSHNSKDKPIVRSLGEALKDRGLKVWLDEWELQPGRPWQEALEEIIGTTKSSAILVGADGLGPWEVPEMWGLLDEFVKRRLPVIPVLLPGASAKPELPLFLRQFTWVDLREGLTEDGIERLIWGIAGRSQQRVLQDADTRKAEWTKKREREQLDPVVRLSPTQMFWLFIFLAVLSCCAFFINEAIAFVFLALTASFGLFGFLGAVAQVENQWGRFGGSAALFIATLLIVRPAGGPTTVDIKGTVELDGEPVDQAIVYLLDTSHSDSRRQIVKADRGRFEFRGVTDIRDMVRLEVDVEAPDNFEPVRKEYKLSEGNLRVNLDPASMVREISSFVASDGEKSAVEEIVELRGIVQREEGEGGSGKVWSLDLSRCRVKDDQLKRWLPQIDTSEITVLVLTNGTITGSALQSVAELKRLRRLDLNRCGGIRASDLEYLKDMTSLEYLGLAIADFKAVTVQPGIIDAGLIHLEDLTGLKALDLSYTNAGATNEFFPYLETLVELRQLNLSHTNIRDHHLPVLKNYRQLLELNLNSTEVSDDGLKTIGQLYSLEKLQLQDTSITKEGLTFLSQLTSLDSLNLLENGIKKDDEEVQALIKELKDKTGRDINLPGWTQSGS